MVGGSTEEVRAWLVRVRVDIRRIVILILAIVTIAIPILLTAIVACIDIVIEAEVTIASAIVVSAIVHDLHALACTATEEVILSTIVGKYFLLALLAHLFSEYLLEVD
jgi:hypothetical protein